MKREPRKVKKAGAASRTGSVTKELSTRKAGTVKGGADRPTTGAFFLRNTNTP